MKKILLVIFFIGILAEATTINIENSWGCITENKDIEMDNAIQNNDKKAIYYLIDYGYCHLLKKGQEVSIIDDSSSFKTKIRIYPKNKRPVEIWVLKWWLSK